MKLSNLIRQEPLSVLLLAIPLALVADLGSWGPVWVLIFSSLAVIPLAGYIGKSTDAIAHRTGPALGGFLNATFGNAAELIITIVAIQKGLLMLVKASITGSILGNLLLVLGMAVLLGGLRNGIQRFDRQHAQSNAILLILAVLTLLIPSFFSGSIGVESDPKVEALSMGVAGVMIIIYILGLIFRYQSPRTPLLSDVPDEPAEVVPAWSIRTAIIILALSTVGVAVLSEFLVGSVEQVVGNVGVSEFFMGIIFIPIIGNVAEHLVAVQVAVQNKMALSVEIAIASSLQVALFVAPVLVFISLLLGHPLTLVFNGFELLALVAGALITALVSADGETNWLEGAELLGIYLILGLAFFLLPS